MPSSLKPFKKLICVTLAGSLLVANIALAQTAEEIKARAAERAAKAAQAQAEAQALNAAAQQAQAAAAAPVAIDPNSFYGKESTEGVYVRDSALALEKFALAQKMERLKEWGKSADVYQEVIEKYPDRVVPSRTNDDDKIVQYTSVTRGVTERLAKWPKEGLDVYRARFEPTAAGVIHAAGPNDLAEMHRVFARYFVTETAKNVGLRLVDINLERGEFQAAARLADELLNWHPDLAAERPSLLYRAALAHKLSGEEAKAKERLATLQKNHADAIGTVRGKQVKLAESLANELQNVTTPGYAASLASADSWTMLGGDPSRSRVSPAGGRPGARLFNVAMTKPQWRTAPIAQKQRLEQLSTLDFNAGRTIGVFPVVDRGELFFQDGSRVYARTLESGAALPGWLQTYPGPEERAGQYVLPNAVGSPRTHQLSLTLTDRAVLGIMGQPDRTMTNAGIFPAGESKLVCLDRRTGNQNWLAGLSTVELPKDLPDDQQKSIRGLQMNGSPLVVGDSVLVSARGVKQAQFEDAWVLCFHLGTGKFRWSCYLASSSNVGAPWGVFNQNVENTSHLAYANGRVYALSNLGALAAMDAYSGTIVWLDIYERGGSPFGADRNFNPFINRGGFGGGEGAQAQVPASRPWEYNPVIVRDGNVFVLPGESHSIFVYDANTGAEVKRVKRSDFGDATMLLAVIGERAVLAGRKKIFCVNWRKYDPEKADESLVWSSAEFPDELRGRPFVTSDSVFVTDASRLSRLKLDDGRVVDNYPKDWKPWDEKEEGPGNVLVTADHVVIAGAGSVYGYTDLGLARARLDREVAAAPQDAAPRMRYAEILFTAGEPATSIGKLDEVIKMLGGMGSMRVGADRDWVFNDALAFAQKLGEAPAGESRAAMLKLAAAFYDRAAAAASTPQQQVHYRLSRARFAESANDAPGAAKLYQEILSEAELRPVPLLDDANGGPTQAAIVAEQAIRGLMARAGVAVYDPFEQAAAKSLADAQAKTPVKPEELLVVAQSYPNARVAPKAMLAAADAYEAAGSARPAVQVLRQMYFKYPQSDQKARILESMARNYLALPRQVEVAAARLAQGAALPGEHKLTKSLRLPDGREIAKDKTFSEALDELRKFSGQVAAKNLPDFGLPVPPAYPPAAERQRNPRWPFPAAGTEPVVENVAALAVPLRDFARSDRVVAWLGDGKTVMFKPGDVKPIASSATAISEPPKGSAWVNDGVLVWGASSVALVPERGGDATWRVALKDLPNVDVVKMGGIPEVAAQQLQRQRDFIVGGNVIRRQQVVMQDGRVRQVVVPPGANNRPDPAAAEQVIEVKPVGERVLVATTTGRLLGIESTTGRVAWQTRLSDRPADRIAANEDFTVLKVSDEVSVRLIALDTFTGQIRGTSAFANQNGIVPLNIALSADGTLVYTLPDKLVLRDLYKPWDEGARDVTGGGQGGGAPPYLNAIGPDQLVIAEGRILALSEAVNPPGAMPSNSQLKKYVRVHSLETGQPITLPQPGGGGLVDLQFYAGTDQWDVKLRVIGARLYVINPRTVLCYNLDRPEESWEGTVDDAEESTVPNVRDVMFGQKHVVLLSQPGSPQPRTDRHMLLAYARYPRKSGDTAESGRIDYEPTILEKQPGTQWQGVEGGFYYLSGDGKLHFLSAK